MFADGPQFLAVRPAGFRIIQLQRLQCVEYDLRNDEPGIFLVVRGNDIPRRMSGAGRAEAGFIGLHVIFPESPFHDVGLAEFPVFFRIVNAFEKPPALFVLGQVQEKFDDAGAVAVQVFFQVENGAIPFFPDRSFIQQFRWNLLGAKQFRMHAHDEHLLIIGAIEDANASTSRQTAGRAPEKVMFQVIGIWLFETENLATLRVDARQHVFDGAVLAAGVHRLKNQQHGVLVPGIQQVLLPAQ